MRRIAAVAITLAFALGGCSAKMESKQQADGSCIQTRTKRFIGIPYSTSDYRVNCASS